MDPLETLRDLIPEILEAMFFSEVELTQQDFGWDGAEDERVWTKIELHTPLERTMWLSAPTVLVSDWAQMLTDEDPTEEILKEVLGELANTLAGKLEIALAREDEETKVGLPEGGLGSAPVPEMDNVLTFEANDSLISVGLHEAA